MCKVKVAWLVFHVGDRTGWIRWPWSTVRLEPFITRCDGYKQTWLNLDKRSSNMCMDKKVRDKNFCRPIDLRGVCWELKQAIRNGCYLQLDPSLHPFLPLCVCVCTRACPGANKSEVSSTALYIEFFEQQRNSDYVCLCRAETVGFHL